jgi:carbamoyl-phosphate synthase large subunit
MGRHILITRAGTGAADNLIRSLRAGDRDLHVIGCHHDRFALRQSTADANYLIHPPSHPAFIASLRHVVESARIDLLLPTTDADVRALADVADTLACRLFLPQRSVIELCQDKHDLAAFLRVRNVPAPLTHAVPSLNGVDEVFRRLAPPVPLWCRVRRGSGALGATPVHSSQQAQDWIRWWGEIGAIPAESFTLSAYLPGRSFSAQSLWKDGRMIVVKTFERLSPFVGGGQPSGVSSVAALARTVREPDIAQVCTAAIRALDEHASGVYCFDLKGDRDGTPCITEINAGRFSMSTNLYDLTGKHNMAALAVRLALDEPVDIQDEYDATDDYYMVRDGDTVPGVFHADDLFETIHDARP